PDSKEELTMYKVSAKQLVSVALFSALLAGVIVACAQRILEHRSAPVEPVAIADPTVATDEQNNIEIYKAVSPGVVNITNTVLQEGYWGVFPSEGTGSGSIIDDKGDILTNFHVVQNATRLEVQIENDKYPATVVGTDRDNDLAVIKVDVPRGHRFTAVSLGSSSGLQVGQKVLAIGNPFGLQRTLTTGIISGLERPLRDPASRRTIQGAIQTDASINPGNSGGPLLNSKGEMIGITTMPLDRRIARGMNLPVEQGLIVGDVTRGSGAASAGLRGAVVRESIWGGIVLQQIGDVVLTVDGQKVTSTDDLQNALQDKKPGQSVDVEVLRAGSKMTVPVRLSERPPELR